MTIDAYLELLVILYFLKKIIFLRGRVSCMHVSIFSCLHYEMEIYRNLNFKSFDMFYLRVLKVFSIYMFFDFFRFYSIKNYNIAHFQDNNMSFEILIAAWMEFDEVWRKDRKERLSRLPILWCIQIKDISLLATRWRIILFIWLLQCTCAKIINKEENIWRFFQQTCMFIIQITFQ